MPRGRLLEYCVVLRHLVTHCAATSISRATFKFRLFLGPPSYQEFTLPSEGPVFELPAQVA